MPVQSWGTEQHIEGMMEEVPFRTIPTPEQSELGAFASWFHQDWRLVYPDFLTGAKMYVEALPGERRKGLSAELRAFIEAHSVSSEEEIRKAWYALGAGAWQTGLQVPDTLHAFLALTETK